MIGTTESEERFPTRPANFYALPFASQMIVWALRKRMLALFGGNAGTDDVLPVFHMANWGELYAALLAVADVLARADLCRKLQLHAIGCPCLAPHEAHVLNALVHLQRGLPEESVLCLVETLVPDGVRQALPHLRTIAQDLVRQNLRLVFVDLPPGEPIELAATAPSPSPEGPRHVH
jgi:hypothetical protein